MSVKTGSVVKGILGRLTSWNLQVGKGVITPKNSYRFPAPGSQPTDATPGAAAVKLPVKEEDLADQRYEERQMKLVRQAGRAQRRALPDDPLLDPRNMFGATFQGLPPTPPLRVYRMREMHFNTQGERVPLEPEARVAAKS